MENIDLIKLIELHENLLICEANNMYPFHRGQKVRVEYGKWNYVAIWSGCTVDKLGNVTINVKRIYAGIIGRRRVLPIGVKITMYV